MCGNIILTSNGCWPLYLAQGQFEAMTKNFFQKINLKVVAAFHDTEIFAYRKNASNYTLHKCIPSVFFRMRQRKILPMQAQRRRCILRSMSSRYIWIARIKSFGMYSMLVLRSCKWLQRSNNVLVNFAIAILWWQPRSEIKRKVSA